MKKLLAVSLLALALPMSASYAVQPQGFQSQAAAVRAPQGFENGAVTTVAQVMKSGKDHQIVTLEGKFTDRVRKDRYTFVDNQGDKIIAELDDDRDWSHVVKDQPVKIIAEIDKDWNGIELEVMKVVPLK